jgi:hypothetical protein
MKKNLFLWAMMIFVFASCEGPAGRDGLDGESIGFYVENITVKSQDWKYVSSDRYVTLYQYIVNMDIREDAYENGIVNAYLFQWNSTSKSEVQTPLPYWIQHTDGANTWLEGYNFDFDKGTIAFYVEWKNGVNPPESYFRVAVAP